MFDKKTLPLIILLAILVLFYFQIMEFLGFYKPPTRAPQREQPVTADSIITAPNTTAGWVGLDTLSATAPPAVTPPLGSATDSLPTDTVRIMTNKFEVVLVSTGGGVTSLILPDYTYRDGQPIQLLPDAQAPVPEVSFAGGTLPTSQMRFKSNLGPGRYDATSSPVELTFTYGESGQGEIVRKYRFYPDKYHFDLIVELRDPAKLGLDRMYKLAWNSPLGVTEPQPETDYQSMEAVAMMAGSRVKLDEFQNDRLDQSLNGNPSWAGVRSKYFAAVLIPKNRIAEGAFAQGERRKVVTAEGRIEERRLTAGLDMPFASAGILSDTFAVFVGPLDYTLMAQYKVGLQDMLDIGTTPFVGWIIKSFALAVIWLLPKMYSVIANYGVVIILFALLVKLVTLPLSLKSFKSMSAMKALQPKIEELKIKHKKNPQSMNAEVMKLYKAHGVNPFSGCLPILLQMPLFFALFSVFRSTILLRDAPFVWFIDDLSRGAASLTDPYIILVVLMIVTQYFSQQFTMASTTQQNKILMYVFPLFMGFLLYKFPAGLVLYWTCFSVFSLLDYFLYKRGPKVSVAAVSKQ
ncbi:MAG TPA: membrane protein insertase YidC [Candidatus Deferrimicrobium sp.]|nr:membrane protein insertase YidC [Candidatus Deferrimicrobium sp.]